MDTVLTPDDPDCDCEAMPPSDPELPAHTVTVTAGGLVINGVTVHPDSYDLGGGRGGARLHLYFDNVELRNAEPQQADTTPGSTEPTVPAGYVDLNIEAYDDAAAARRVRALMDALPGVVVRAKVTLRGLH